VLNTRETALGKWHVDTIESMSQLAIYYQNERKYAKATPFYEKVLAADTKVHGEDGIETLRSSGSVARVYLLQGRIQEASEVQGTAYQRSLAKYGVEHDCTQGGIAVLAQIAYARGEREKARELQQGVLEYHVKNYGTDHPWTEECKEDMDKMSDST
jgi:tetratricopeptide (TPR) repeat protein